MPQGGRDNLVLSAAAGALPLSVLFNIRGKCTPVEPEWTWLIVTGRCVAVRSPASCPF